jgi:hypothetical protein
LLTDRLLQQLDAAIEPTMVNHPASNPSYRGAAAGGFFCAAAKSAAVWTRHYDVRQKQINRLSLVDTSKRSRRGKINP